MFDGVFANPLHWGILLVVVLIIFGPGKFPGVGSALGQSLREFKKASNEETPRPPAGVAALSSSATAPTADLVEAAVCVSCGKSNEAGARFCSGCGAVIGADALVEENVTSEAPKPAPAKVPAVCSACQTENRTGSQFCAHCGRLLEPAGEPV